MSSELSLPLVAYASLSLFLALAVRYARTRPQTAGSGAVGRPGEPANFPIISWPGPIGAVVGATSVLAALNTVLIVFGILLLPFAIGFVLGGVLLPGWLPAVQLGNWQNTVAFSVAGAAWAYLVGAAATTAISPRAIGVLLLIVLTYAGASYYTDTNVLLDLYRAAEPPDGAGWYRRCLALNHFVGLYSEVTPAKCPAP